MDDEPDYRTPLPVGRMPASRARMLAALCQAVGRARLLGRGQLTVWELVPRCGLPYADELYGFWAERRLTVSLAELLAVPEPSPAPVSRPADVPPLFAQL